MRALIIHSRWIEEILAGRKGWELRARRTRARGERIGLFAIGQRRIVGVVEIVGCRGPFTLAELSGRFNQHRVPLVELKEYLKKWNDKAFAYTLSNPRRLREPIALNLKRGQQTWIKQLPARVVRRIDSQSSD